ncbi:hypothetical protein WBG78_28405 [Chryseolinea sp. T2]|uniref:hypothetical protein n=1 Tax=Chryseolinea sp. T2 TaxID=3129255 RepID=UPI003076F988
MKIVNLDIDNGRPVSNDDLRILQEELYKAIQYQYAGLGAFILQNVTVAGLNVTSGLVYINGLVLEFDATTVSSFPQYIVQAPNVDVDMDLTELGDSFAKRTIQKAELSSSVPGSGEYIILNSTGGRNYNDILANQFVRVSGNQNIAGTKNFSAPVISNGINVNDALNTINSTGWVTTARIADFNVTHGKIAGNSIDATRLQDSSVTASKIVDGNVTTNKIADANVTTAKLADGSVTTNKIADSNVTAAKLASDVNLLFTGNGASTDLSVDFSTVATYTTRTYGNKLFTLTNNPGKMRPLVYFQCQLARDSGGSDFCQLQLQRSTNLSSWVTIATRSYKLDGDSWTTGAVLTVDSGASSGTNWYRLVATVTSGGLCYMSNNYTATIVGVTLY